MKTCSLLLSVILLCALDAHAQEVNTSNRTDSSSLGQKTVADTLCVDPLANKQFGIEFRPFMFVLRGTSGGDERSTFLAGGFSLFAVDRQGEISFPVLYAHGRNNSIPWTILNFEATYRRYLGGQQRGVYLSGGFRYTYDIGQDLSAPPSTFSAGSRIVQNKFGLYVGIGYRYFHPLGWFWGANILVGRYLDEDSRHVGDRDLSTGPFLIDYEFFNIGYAF